MESGGTPDRPQVRDALILPVVLGVATWAVDRFTRSGLGGWRYVPVAVLGLATLYFTLLAVVVGVIVNVDRFDGRRMPRWPARTRKPLFVAFIAAAVVVQLVLAVRDDSVLDGVTALVIVLWAVFVPGPIGSSTAFFSGRRRGRKRGYQQTVGLLMPLWFLVLALIRLH